MKLPVSPFYGDRLEGLAEWLRSAMSSVAAGWSVEHTPTGGHDWHWAPVPYSSGAFTGSASMTWSVGGEDVTWYECGRLGDCLRLTFVIEDTDVGGTASTELRVALPPGYAVSGYWYGALRYIDAGTTGTGHVAANDGDRFVRCFTTTGANWTLTTSDDTSVQGSIEMRVTKD